MGRLGVLAAIAVAAVLGMPAARAQDPMLSPPPLVAPAQQTPAAPAVQAPSPQPPPPAQNPPAKHKGKQPYTGPANVIELAAAPVLDGEGRQRLDPDGNPMFSPPLKQQRDKYGHPLFDDKGQPVFQTATELGFDEHGKKVHTKKEKPSKKIAVSISKGTLTVDGMIGKAALNYDISDLKFMYLWAPWVGTVVVSNVMFPGATEQRNGFNGYTLTVNVEDHTFQLYSEKMILGKKPEPAFVQVDPEFKLPSQRPEFGYGATLSAPYTWPGSKKNPESKAFVKPPPVPANLRATQLLPPCPPGQMRATSRVELPADDAPPPCVALANGRAATVDAAPAEAAPVPTVNTPAPAQDIPAVPATPSPMIPPATNGNPAAGLSRRR